MSLRDSLAAAICKLSGVSQRASRYSDQPAFYIADREFAHFHDGNVIDIRLTRPVIRELINRGATDARLVVRSTSDWAEFTFSHEGDLVRALELVEDAVIENR